MTGSIFTGVLERHSHVCNGENGTKFTGLGENMVADLFANEATVTLVCANCNKTKSVTVNISKELKGKVVPSGRKKTKRKPPPRRNPKSKRKKSSKQTKKSVKKKPKKK